VVTSGPRGGAGPPTMLRFVLDARIQEGTWGGVQQAAIGLAFGLSQLSGSETYHFLAYHDEAGWLAPLVKGNCGMVEIDKPGASWSKIGHRLEALGLPRLARLNIALSDRVPERVVSDLGAQVVHFVHQAAFATSARRIYQPHDLQHLHFPEFFSMQDARRRNHLYLTNCRRSDMIVVMSRWGRRDLVDRYALDENKVYVIPWAAPIEAYESPTSERIHDVRCRYDLPPRYLLYPAQTWPHKNHVRLLEALRQTGDRKFDDIQLVCTGHLGAHFPAIADEASRLDVAHRIRFLGWIPSSDMAAIYRSAVGLVFPSLFEGWGLPVVESFHAGIPVACSRIPVLEEQAGDAAVYFDPTDPADLAEAMIALWTDGELRDRLVILGRGRAASLDWRTIAETFRAHYRRLAGASLTDRDHALIGLSRSGAWLPSGRAVDTEGGGE
jgi:glycosyltransferase involved in cell wall biosynthesis